MNKLKLLRNDDIHFQLVMAEGIGGGDENGSFQNQPEEAATASRLSRAASKKRKKPRGYPRAGYEKCVINESAKLQDNSKDDSSR